MKRPKCTIHPLFAAGLILNGLRVMLDGHLVLPDFAWGFVEGVCIGLMILGALMTAMSPERRARLKNWKRKYLFGGNSSC